MIMGNEYLLNYNLNYGPTVSEIQLFNSRSIAQQTCSYRIVTHVLNLTNNPVILTDMNNISAIIEPSYSSYYNTGFGNTLGLDKPGVYIIKEYSVYKQAACLYDKLLIKHASPLKDHNRRVIDIYTDRLKDKTVKESNFSVVYNFPLDELLKTDENNTYIGMTSQDNAYMVELTLSRGSVPKGVLNRYHLSNKLHPMSKDYKFENNENQMVSVDLDENSIDFIYVKEPDTTIKDLYINIGPVVKKIKGVTDDARPPGLYIYNNPEGNEIYNHQYMDMKTIINDGPLHGIFLTYIESKRASDLNLTSVFKERMEINKRQLEIDHIEAKNKAELEFTKEKNKRESIKAELDMEHKLNEQKLDMEFKAKKLEMDREAAELKRKLLLEKEAIESELSKMKHKMNMQKESIDFWQNIVKGTVAVFTGVVTLMVLYKKVSPSK